MRCGVSNLAWASSANGCGVLHVAQELRLRLPETLSQSPASVGATLHRFLRPPPAVRSPQDSVASPRSVRVRRGTAAGARVARPKPSRAVVNLGRPLAGDPQQSVSHIGLSLLLEVHAAIVLNP